MISLNDPLERKRLLEEYKRQAQELKRKSEEYQRGITECDDALDGFSGTFGYKTVSEAKKTPDRIKNLLSILLNCLENPVLAGSIKASNLQSLHDAIDNEFQTLFGKYLETVTANTSTEKKSGKEKSSAQKIKNDLSSDVHLYIEDITGLMNCLYDQNGTKLSSEQHIELKYATLNLIEEWLIQLDDHNLVPSELHKCILTYSVHLSSQLANSHIQSAEQLKRESPQVATLKFETALNMENLNSQNIEMLSTLYNKNNMIVQSFSKMNQIEAQSFLGYIDLARNNLEQGKDNYLLKTRIDLASLVYITTSSFVYSLIKQSNANPHEILFWLEWMIDDLSVLILKWLEVDSTLNREVWNTIMSDNIETYDVQYEKYLSKIRETASPYPALSISNCCSDIIEFTIPADTNLPKRLFSMPGVFLTREKEKLTLSFTYKTSIHTIEQAIIKLGELIKNPGAFHHNRNPNPKGQQYHKTNKRRKPNKHKAPHAPVVTNAVATIEQEPLPLETDGDLKAVQTPTLETTAAPLEKTDVDLKAIDVLSNELSKIVITTTQDMKNEEITHNSSLTDEAEQENFSYSYVPYQKPIQAKPIPSPVSQFPHPRFENTDIKELNGAKGIFVAYNSSISTEPHKLDPVLKKKFVGLFKCPQQAAAINSTGFKWIFNGEQPVLVGKLPRESYRMFPIDKKINTQGETGFVYGEIRNTKNGKKANRYN